MTVYSGVDDVFRRPIERSPPGRDPPQVRAPRTFPAVCRRDLPAQELHPPRPGLRGGGAPSAVSRWSSPAARTGFSPSASCASPRRSASRSGSAGPGGSSRRTSRAFTRWPMRCCCRRCSSRAGCRCSRRWRRDVPVVTADRYGTKELAENAAVLVDPESVDAIADGIRRVLDDSGAPRAADRRRSRAERRRSDGAGARRRRSACWNARRGDGRRVHRRPVAWSARERPAPHRAAHRHRGLHGGAARGPWRRPAELRHHRADLGTARAGPAGGARGRSPRSGRSMAAGSLRADAVEAVVRPVGVPRDRAGWPADPVSRAWTGSCPSRSVDAIACVVTVHDLGWQAHPELYAPRVRLMYRALFPWAVRRADRFIAVSRYTADDLMRRAGRPRLQDRRGLPRTRPGLHVATGAGRGAPRRRAVPPGGRRRLAPEEHAPAHRGVPPLARPRRHRRGVPAADHRALAGPDFAAGARLPEG